MPRPCRFRHISGSPKVRYFKPRGIPLSELEEVILSEDGLEAVRLADVESLYHETAAEQMKVSRATFGRILAQARKSIAKALVMGKALRIEGGSVEVKKPGFCRRGRMRRGCKRNLR